MDQSTEIAALYLVDCEFYPDAADGSSHNCIDLCSQLNVPV